jgi:hypothetical protein
MTATRPKTRYASHHTDSRRIWPCHGPYDTAWQSRVNQPVNQPVSQHAAVWLTPHSNRCSGGGVGTSKSRNMAIDRLFRLGVSQYTMSTRLL